MTFDLMLRRFYLLNRIVQTVRDYRRRARHHKIVKLHKLQYYQEQDRGVCEVRARDLLRRAENASAWNSGPLYPAGGAAGALLLYLLMRALNELPLRRVLELGAGQTTRLLNAWATDNNGSVVTFEHDKDWAASVSGEVDSDNVQILYLPLKQYSAPDGLVQWYSEPSANMLPQEGFDLLVVDGPVGTARLSRYGIVEHIPGWLNQNWLIIWDDLDRPADLKSFALLIDRLRSGGIEHGHVILDGDRTVGLVYTPAYSAVRFMW